MDGIDITLECIKHVGWDGTKMLVILVKKLMSCSFLFFCLLGNDYFSCARATNKQTNKAEVNVTAWQVGTHSENKPKTYKLANSLIKRLP